MLTSKKTIALILSDRLGDALIGMICAYQLRHHGYNVVVYCDYLVPLIDWFPDFNIFSYPNFSEPQQWKNYDLLLVQFYRDYVESLRLIHPTVKVMSEEPLFKTQQSMASIHAQYCKDFLSLSPNSIQNGIKPLANLTYRKYKRRIAIHPSSTDPLKVWPSQKFIKLAEQLKILNYQPVFIVTESEYVNWQHLDFPTVISPVLSQIAAFIYESDYFIGCDSGLGHLASNLKIPTLSLCIRKGTARMWRPAWYKNQVVLAPWWLLIRPIKDRLWKQTITVKNVLQQFKQLVTDENVFSLKP